MRARFGTLCFLALTIGLGWIVESRAQTASEVWQDVPATTVLAARRAVASQRTVVPRIGRSLRVTRTALDKALAKAPQEFSGEPGAEFPLPMPDGTFARFAVEESSLMEPGLAARYPQLKTYIARGIDDPGLTARLDVTPQGFHALVLGADGVSFYVDPFWRDDANYYIAYRRRDFVSPKTLQCGVTGKPDPAVKLARAVAAPRPTGATLRTYRLAVACTGEYAAAAGGGTLLGTLGAIVTSVNRVSAVYERDLSIRLKLVSNEDQVIFLDANTDGFTDGNPDLLIDESQAKIDAVIGNANYDIGHLFSTGGGGLAGLGVVGRTGQKASGVTGTTNPVGDPYDIDYVAHEMGHQFGGNHPFNATSGSCSSTNRNGPTAYEPGSGTTIMAYAGICSPQDLAPHSDDYFHTISYDEIDAYTSGSSPGNVGVATVTGNTPPTIAVLTNRTIPMGTPFALTASATDPNVNDVLTYCWEEFDLGAAQDPTVAPRDNGSAPIFRSFDPSRKPTRIFPSLSYILNNSNVPPAVVSTFATGEFLPATNRTMTFRVTVRDNRAGGGGSNYASMTVTSTTAAGPFAQTSQNASATIAGGSSQTVTWNVASTTAAPVSCANVKISLSTDGGNTFPFVLAASTPNDGTETVTIPSVANVATTQGRIKVEAVGNIFFDISDANLTITSTNTAPGVTIASGITVQRGSLNATTATVGTVSDPNTPLTATILDAPADTTVTAAISGANITVTAQADCSLVTTLSSRTYPLTLSVADSIGSTTFATVNLIVQPNPAPTVGTYSDVGVPRGGSATATPSAAPADANGNLGPAPISIAPIALPGGGTLSINQSTGAITASPITTTTLGATPVTVTVQDTCGAAIVRRFNVNVISTTPAIEARTASAPTAENCVPPNGAPDPAETVTINFSLNNTGAGATSNLVATLQAAGNVIPVTTSQSYGVVGGGASAARAFTFRVNPAAACGSNITPTFQLHDGATSFGTVSYTIRLGVLQNFGGTVQNFDSVTAPALPSGWTSTVVTGAAAAWVTSTTTPDSAPNAVSASGVATVAETRLDSPMISIVSPTAQIAFKHRWIFESGYDGGVLEISINSGAYQDIVTAGGSFAAGGYNGTIDPGFLSPIANRAAWTGTSAAGYTTTTVNLPASAAGQSIRLRWRLGSDDGVAVAGTVWRIDTISLSDSTPLCCGAAPAVTSVLPPAGVVDQAYTHVFATSGTPPPTWSVTAGTLPNGLSLTTGGTLTGTPLVPGIFSGITVTAQNGLTPAGTQNFALTIANTFAHYIATFGFNPANADPDADPDRDGISNLGEYGQNLSANSGSRIGLPVVVLKNYPTPGGDFLSITFLRVTTATELTYQVQVSPDLEDWSIVASSVGGAATSGAGFIQESGTPPLRTVEVRDTTAISSTGGATRYIRLRILKLP